MNQVLYEKRCRCKEEVSVIKKRKPNNLSEGRPFQYHHSNKTEVFSKTFQLKYETKLSFAAKLLLNSFQQKYLYHAIDDILYGLKLTLKERENLLAVLYSPVISLQNNLFINFFDIWIENIYIQKISKINKFLTKNNNNFEFSYYIVITLEYQKRIPIKKPEPLW